MRNQTQQHTTSSTAKPSQPVTAMACARPVEKLVSIKRSTRKSANKSSKSSATPTGNFNFVGLAG